MREAGRSKFLKRGVQRIVHALEPIVRGWPRCLAEGLLACSCEVSKMRRRRFAVVVVHPATRKAHTIKLPRRTTGAAVTVAVFTKARLRLARANPKFHKGHREGSR